ncbi:hypothetical protein BD289DRAFT_87015 [Coniella lustricola]|uniref:Uncharacterized protein n=1 Tax=Coniella lustricola TaxID=2025994 RepID=A0A2T2ZYQ2_9PEZI|nr:hypothetical protein BD289DRAFT_87015 [Coniella lustricola]
MEEERLQQRLLVKPPTSGTPLAPLSKRRLIAGPSHARPQSYIPPADFSCPLPRSLGDPGPGLDAATGPATGYATSQVTYKPVGVYSGVAPPSPSSSPHRQMMNQVLWSAPLPSGQPLTEYKSAQQQRHLQVSAGLGINLGGCNGGDNVLPGGQGQAFVQLAPMHALSSTKALVPQTI